MTDDIVKRLRVWSDWLDERCPDTEVRNDLREAADEIELLRIKIRHLECDRDWLYARTQTLTDRLISTLHKLEQARNSTEPAALRGTPSDGEASASEGYLHTGASVQTEKADR